MPRRSPYSPEVRERAVRMFFEHRPEYPSEWAAMTWHRRQARHDARDAARPGSAEPRSTTVERAGLTTDERQQDEGRSRRRIKELRRANEILKDASIFFATELDGQPKR